MHHRCRLSRGALRAAGLLMLVIGFGCSPYSPGHGPYPRLAESCPEFIAVQPFVVDSSKAQNSDREVKLEIAIPTGTTDGDPISISWKAWDLSQNSVAISTVFDGPPVASATVQGNGNVSTTIPAAARVKKNLAQSYIVEVRVVVTHESKGCVPVTTPFLIVPGTVTQGGMASVSVRADGSELDAAARSKDEQPENVRPESCPEFILPSATVGGAAQVTFTGGTPAFLTFFPPGRECNANARNVKLTYTIFEAQPDGMLHQIRPQDTFDNNSAVDTALENGQRLDTKRTTKQRFVVVTASCIEGCEGKPKTLKSTSFVIVP